MSCNKPEGACDCYARIIGKLIKVEAIIKCGSCKEEHDENCHLVDYELYYLAWLCEKCLIEKQRVRKAASELRITRKLKPEDNNL